MNRFWKSYAQAEQGNARALYNLLKSGHEHKLSRQDILASLGVREIYPERH